MAWSPLGGCLPCKFRVFIGFQACTGACTSKYQAVPSQSIYMVYHLAIWCDVGGAEGLRQSTGAMVSKCGCIPHKFRVSIGFQACAGAFTSRYQAVLSQSVCSVYHLAVWCAVGGAEGLTQSIRAMVLEFGLAV